MHTFNMLALIGGVTLKGFILAWARGRHVDPRTTTITVKPKRIG